MEIIFVLLAVLLNLFIDILISGQYRYLVGFLGKKISFFSSLVIVSLSFFLRILMFSKASSFFGTPIAGKLKEDIPFSKSAVIISFENIIATTWQLLILVIILIFNRKFIEKNMFFAIPLFFLAIIFVIFFLYKHDKFLFLSSKIFNFLPLKLRKLIKKTGLGKESVGNYFLKLKFLFSNKLFLFKYNFFYFLVIIISPMMIFLLGGVYSIHINYFDSFTIYWLSFVLGRLSGLPIGFGIRDLSTGFLLTNIGVSTQISLQIVFLSRIISFIPFFPIGLIYSIHYGKEKIIGIYKELKN